MPRDDLDWFLYQRKFYEFHVLEFEKNYELTIFIHKWFFRKEKLRRELQEKMPVGFVCKIYRVV